MKCILCNGEIEKKYNQKGVMYWDQGENAQPLADGQCCGSCNREAVIPARILEFTQTTRLAKLRKFFADLKENGGERLTVLNRDHRYKLKSNALLRDLYDLEKKLLEKKLRLWGLSRNKESGFKDLTLIGLAERHFAVQLPKEK